MAEKQCNLLKNGGGMSKINRITVSDITDRNSDGISYTVIDKSFLPEEYGTYIVIYSGYISMATGSAIQQNLDLRAYDTSSKTTEVKAVQFAQDNPYVCGGSAVMLVDINSSCTYICGTARCLASPTTYKYNVKNIYLDFVKIN